MSKSIFFIIFLLNTFFCIAQQDYSLYYKVRSEINGNIELKDYENELASRCLKAFSKNKPLPYDLIVVSYHYYKNNNRTKGKKFLMKAALSGLDISNTYCVDYFDSLFFKENNIKRQYYKKHYKSFKNCDVENSIKIIKLYESDQITRSYLRDYENDTNFSKYKWKEVEKSDSVNYYSLLKILNSDGFNSIKLSYEAKFALSVILMHSSTNNYVNPDTVFALLKKEMLKGVVGPASYANSVDRYYMSNKGMNYYCNFYAKELPIYDIANIDKRRAEVWLYPLYLKFKWNNNLDKLPKDYKYDIDTIK